MPEPKEPSVQSTRWRLSEAALLAVIPAYAFYLAFRYETGIADYYGYPNYLIAVSLENVFIAFGAVLLFAIFLFFVVNFIFSVVAEENQENLVYFAPLIVSVLIVLSDIILRKRELIEFAILNGFVFLFCLFIYLPPLFSRKKYGGYFASLKASEDAEDVVKRRSIIGKISLRVGYHSFLAIIILLFFMPGLASSVGHRDARLKSSYLVFEKDKEFVVLKTYGETMICAPFNRKEKTFDQTFFLRPLTSNPEIAFNAERVGPLKPKD